MSKNIRFELNRAGVSELLNSPQMAGILSSAAGHVADASGNGYSAEIIHPGTRAVAVIRAETKEAYRDNMENNSLLKALGGTHI